MATYAPTTPFTAFTKEELDPELRPFLGESPIGTVLKAPLLFMVPYLPQLAAIANRHIAASGKRSPTLNQEATGKGCSGCTRSRTG